MAHLPPNIRSRSPRPLFSRNRAARLRRNVSATAAHGWRRDRLGEGIEEPTPTPPPMVVSRPGPAADAPRQAALDKAAVAAPIEPPRSRRTWTYLALVALMFVASATGLRYARATGQLPWSNLASSMQAAHGLSPADTDDPHAAAAVASKEPESNWTVTHEGHIAIAGGVMFIPKTFVPAADGTYDLVLHFHGNVNIVLESVEHAGLNAVVAVVNWGIRSAPYRDTYQVPDAFEKLLAQIEQGVRTRGVKTAKLGRLALTSWSAGYGAIESILEHRKSPAAGADPLDAVIAIDGVHGAFLDGDPKRLKERTLLAWVNAAKAAAKGGVMLSMTHSEIDPIEFASTQRSQHYVIDQLDEPLVSPPVLRPPPHLALESAKIAVAQGKEKRMIPIMDGRLRNLRVQGFEGITKEHHIAHLTQMAAVVLPDLVERWKKPRQDEEDMNPSSSSEQ